jgi:hypothetical protein
MDWFVVSNILPAENQKELDTNPNLLKPAAIEVDL